MSDESAILANSLSKTYKLYHSHRDRVKELIHPLRKCYHQKYHALKDIDLKVKNGEVLGIIGQNGSGKSTLLKILSSVVEPTSGNFSCNGKVTALLELGGGFNKDLSGLENIYFLGGLQGYSKKEMHRRVDHILEFADIGVYAHQPVNNYSSGMYIRLAFSVAINIDPDILIIDEALAVGDMRFQQKCFRKIREFRDAGKTMLLCSHSLGAIRDFCTKAMWLHEGKIMEEGDPVFVTDRYSAFMTARVSDLLIRNPASDADSSAGHTSITEDQPLSEKIDLSRVDQCDSYGIGGASIKGVALYNSDTNQPNSIFSGGENVCFYVAVAVETKLHKPGIQMVLNGAFGSPVFQITNYHYNQDIAIECGQTGIVRIGFTFPHIGNGNYTISVGFLDMNPESRSELHWIHEAVSLEVANPNIIYKLGTQLALDHADFQVFN